jgi:hypothetical protein
MSHSHRKALGTGLATTLAVGAIVAPGALAEPRDLGTPVVREAAAATQGANDLRSPDARDAAARPDSSAAPQWPAHPQVIGHRASAAVDTTPVQGTASSGFDWSDAAIGAAAVCTLLVAGVGGTLVVRRVRRPQVVPAAHGSR